MYRSRLTLFVLLFPLLLNSQKKRAIPEPAEFDAYIQNALSYWKTPGLSVLVVKDGQLVFKKAYGVRDLTTKLPYTTSTLSTCASTTKAMTAVCIGMLVDEGKIKWTDIVADILPEFKLSSPFVTSEIKVKDLLTHNAGLGNADMLWVLGYSSEEILKRMQRIPMAYSLRSSFIYQNLMYMVAGELIHKVSGKTWDEFITERIFKPLGMTNTYARHSRIPASALKTTSHYKNRDQGDSILTIPYLASDNVDAAGGVWSCSDDMAKWVMFIMDSARINGKRLLEPASFAELFKPQSMVTESEFYPTATITKPHWTTYGLGWFQQDYRGKMVQFHTGSLDGLVAIFGMIPDEHVAIYVYGNLDHSEIRHALMFKSFDLWAFHDNYKDWSKEFFNMYKNLSDSARKKSDEQAAKRVMGTSTSLSLDSYAGNYESDIYGKAWIELKDNVLVLNVPGGYSLKLEHWNYDTFRGQFNYWWYGKSYIQFLLNGEGKITGFSMEGVLYNKEISK